MLILFKIYLILLSTKRIQGSHFRGGIITALPQSYTDTTVTMSVTTYFA
jgi:hypothetical protein